MGNLTRECFESLWKLRKEAEDLETFVRATEIVIENEGIEALREMRFPHIEWTAKKMKKLYDEVKDCNFKAKFETDAGVCRCFTPEKKIGDEEELDFIFHITYNSAKRLASDPTKRNLKDLAGWIPLLKKRIDKILLGCNCLD